MLKIPFRKLYFVAKVSLIFVLVLVTLSLYEYWRGGKRATRAFTIDTEEDLFEKQILEDEARIIPGLGEGGRPAYLSGEDKRLGEESEKKYALNTYLSDRIAYNRTLKDFRNPACDRVTYDAELPSTSVIIIFHNEPYSVVVRTIWSVLNTARRDQPWHRRANFLESGTGRVMKLGYSGQPENSEHVYLKEIILVDDNSTLPELRGKLARYVRTRLPPDMVRILRLPDRIGLTRARHAGAGAATGDILIFLDSHCEGDHDWLRPLLHRIKHSPKIGLTQARHAGAGAATGDILVFLDSHCEGVRDWLRPLLHRIKHSPKLGLTRARLAGARAASGDILVFLDSHCEGNRDWLRPLLQRLKNKPNTVLVPDIDVIEIDTLEYNDNGGEQNGLMRARVTGARAARGDVLVFLDAHCEAESDWLRPLLQRIRHKRDAVPTPVIDVVDQTTFHLDGEDPIQVGGFTFVGHFTWIDVPEREKKRRGSDIAPTWSPTMAGGLFAIRRAYYWELGAYDEQMAGWGGENLEMSFRIWQCGGTLETIPCSRVGHVFRAFHPNGLPVTSNTQLTIPEPYCHYIKPISGGGTLETIPCSRVGHVFRAFHPYGLPATSDTHGGSALETLPCARVGHVFRDFHPYDDDSDSFGINTARMAEVWMDDYAELFYMHRPDLRKNPIIGDVTHRKILREKLHCKNFQWFLDNVYQEKYVPVRDSLAFGRVQSTTSKFCLDTMQRDGEASPLGFYPCHKQLTDTQYLSLSLAGQLRDEERCADVQYMRNSHVSGEDENEARLVVMVTCRDRFTSKMQWRHIAATGQLQHIETGMCLDVRGARAGDDARARPCAEGGAPEQRWQFDYKGDDMHSGTLPKDLEDTLNRIRGQRRTSRSLLEARAPARDDEEPSPSARRLRGAGRMREHARALRKPAKKKVHKNKFIITIERMLPNKSMEHLEVDIHCKHRKLYPNNSFVRDLVTILNDKNIRVINNGRVFEKNKVTDLKKDRDNLRKKGFTRTPGSAEEANVEATTVTEPPPSTTGSVTDRSSTERHSKKHHHKKRPKFPKSLKYPKEDKPKSRSHDLSLLLDKDADYHFTRGNGPSNRSATFSKQAYRYRGRQTDSESEKDNDRDDSKNVDSTIMPLRDNEAFAATARLDSAELRLSEDRARDSSYRERHDRGKQRVADGERAESRVRNHKAKHDRNKDRTEDARDERPVNEVARDRDEVERTPYKGGSDLSKENEKYATDTVSIAHQASSLRDDEIIKAREDAIQRHAAVYEFKKVAGERPASKDRRSGKSRAQILSEFQLQSKTEQPKPDHTDQDWHRRDDKHPAPHRDAEPHSIEIHVPTHQEKGSSEHREEIKGLEWPTEQDQKGKTWDPWVSGGLSIRSHEPQNPPKEGVHREDARKRNDPHDVVEKLVFEDVWDKENIQDPKDQRVANLAKEVLDYEDLTEKPILRESKPSMHSDKRGKVPSEKRGKALGEKRGKALGEKRDMGPSEKRDKGPSQKRGKSSSEKRGKASSEKRVEEHKEEHDEELRTRHSENEIESHERSEHSDKHSKGLRLRLKSNMTFNLGDDLLNWRRIQMSGATSESESGDDDEMSS